MRVWEYLTGCIEVKKAYRKLKEEYEACRRTCPKNPPLPIDLEVLNYRQLNSFVRTYLDVQNWCLDEYYYTCSQRDFLNIVEWDWINRKTYTPEYFDCDDFSFLFKSHCKEYFNITVGLVLDWSSQHAYNAVVYPDGRLALIEPQTDSVFWASQRDRNYLLKDGLIIW